jgi:DNA ligase D-like protein (predicted polymerase)
VPSAETREGVSLSNLDTPLFDGADATKRDLVDYLDAMSARILPVLTGRALSVIRVLRGQDPFMQKNVPKYAPDWLPTVPAWAQSSQRQVRYPVCDDRRTLMWLANQRAVEYHPQLFLGDAWDAPTHLVLDLDPPEPDGTADTSGATLHMFRTAARAALLVREVLDAAGMASAVKTSGAKGVHVVVPLEGTAAGEDVMAATRAVAARAERLDPVLATTAYIKADRGGKVFLDATRSGGATVVAAWSPRVRPGTTVSFPLAWSDLLDADPRDATVRTVPGLLAAAGPDVDPWRDLLPAPQPLDPGLVEEGRTIPVARVAAMHEGKRRAKARREAGNA